MTPRGTKRDFWRSITAIAATPTTSASKVLNLGSHRWSFRPELSLSSPFGQERKWEVEGYINVYFFTDDTSYQGAQGFHQVPLPGLEAHMSYAELDAEFAHFSEPCVRQGPVHREEPTYIGYYARRLRLSDALGRQGEQSRMPQSC